MAENADSILREIKARKQAKKEGKETKGAGKKAGELEISPVFGKIKNLSDNKDLKEVASRVEGQKW